MLCTKRLKITRLAQSTLPVGSPRVNLIDMATHVVPTAEYWRTGVQVPPAPPKYRGLHSNVKAFFIERALASVVGIGLTAAAHDFLT